MERDAQFDLYLYDRLIGQLLRREDSTRVVFSEEYIADSSRAVLGLRFEENLRKTWGTRQRLPAWFSNLLPEGQLRRWIGLDKGVSLFQESELLGKVGHDLPGAVRVLPSDHVRDPAHWDDSPHTPRSEAAGEKWRFSLAGVALKFSMLGGGDRFTAPAVGERGDWIVKTPDPRHAAVPQNEFSMMKFAQRLGIEAPEVRLLHRDQLSDLPEEVWGKEELAYAVRRFDRAEDRSLIHIEDFAQVRGVFPSDKYYGKYETLANLIYRGRDVASLQEFARRLTFNTLIGNGDAHLKNWSLIYRDRRRPVLAPAYDLVSTFSYIPDGHQDDLGLSFRGSKSFDGVGPAGFTWLEKKLGVQAQLSDVACEVAKKAQLHLSELEEDLRGMEAARVQRILGRVQEEAKQF